MPAVFEVRKRLENGQTGKLKSWFKRCRWSALNPRLFRSDYLFLLILALLLLLPFGSVYPNFESFPYQLFFSALASVSVVILAWERIANGRARRLRNLMSRVYPDGGEIKLFRTLRTISQGVTNFNFIPDECRDALTMTIAVLRQSGRYHRIDYLYPRKVLKELESLQQACRDYVGTWKTVQEEIEQFTRPRKLPDGYAWDMLTGNITIQALQSRDFVAYLRDGTRAGAYSPLSTKLGQELQDYVTGLRAKQKYTRR